MIEYINAPRAESVHTTKHDPAIPWQKRAIKALVDAGYKKQVIALMMSCHVRSIANWSRGKPITGPNRERLLHVMESMKVEVSDEG